MPKPALKWMEAIVKTLTTTSILVFLQPDFFVGDRIVTAARLLFQRGDAEHLTRVDLVRVGEHGLVCFEDLHVLVGVAVVLL